METTNLTKVLNDISLEALTEYKRQLGDSRIADTLTVQVENNDTEYTISFMVQDYWKWIENGRGPGVGTKKTGDETFINSLIKWAQRKKLPSGSNSLKQTESFAYAVKRHIEKNGIKAKNTLKNTMEDIGNIDDRIMEALSIDIDNELTKNINK